MNQLSAKELENLLKEGNSINIIDVREVDEVRSGKISGAIHIPLRLLEFRLSELDKEKEYIMVCRSGSRSGLATQFLENQGYNVINMTRGMLAWKGEIE